jgi:MerR family copper efflux transcriptional regulator
MARIPIACSLTANDADTRVEEWRQFLHHRVIEVERSHRSARLRLEDGDDAVLVATGLARREKACCPFFEFRLQLLPEAVWLEVEAPDDAAAILDGLIDLRQS